MMESVGAPMSNGRTGHRVGGQKKKNSTDFLLHVLKNTERDGYLTFVHLLHYNLKMFV